MEEIEGVRLEGLVERVGGGLGVEDCACPVISFVSFWVLRGYDTVIYELKIYDSFL